LSGYGTEHRGHLVTDENKTEDDHDDEGITFSGLTARARLPKKMAEAMAPAAVWLVYSISASIFFYALCHGISLIWK
jgi:hypothetical protein